MATIGSQQIIYEPWGTRTARNAHPAQTKAQVKEERTTGLFAVPTGVDNPITVSVFLSNPTPQPESAEVRIRRVTAGGLTTVFYRILSVPAGEVRKVDLSDLAGQTIEVSVSPISAAIVPSVSVTEYFPADGGIIVRLAKYAGEFVYV